MGKLFHDQPSLDIFALTWKHTRKEIALRVITAYKILHLIDYYSKYLIWNHSISNFVLLKFYHTYKNFNTSGTFFSLRYLKILKYSTQINTSHGLSKYQWACLLFFWDNYCTCLASEPCFGHFKYFRNPWHFSERLCNLLLYTSSNSK